MKTIKELWNDLKTTGLFSGTDLSSYDFMAHYNSNHYFYDKIFIQLYGNREYDGIDTQITNNWKETIQAHIVINNENYSKIYNALLLEYNPIENYDKNSTITTSKSGKEKTHSQSSGTINNGEVSTLTNELTAPFNEDTFHPVGKVNTHTNATENTTNGSGDTILEFEDRTDTITEHTHGNIGVTESVTMLKNEISFRLNTEFYTKIFTDIILTYTW